MRNKLIELIREAETRCEDGVWDDTCGVCPNKGEKYCSRNYLADRLIANGVTVQEWIPVSERLPEQAGMAVLVVAENKFGQKAVVKAFTDYTGKSEFLTNEKEYDLIWETAWKVTHWMPLPEPPKGE